MAYVQPNPIYDAKGVPIHPGDLLRSFHYRDRRRRKWWLYHVAVREGEFVVAVPVCCLEPTLQSRQGVALLTESLASSMEIIQGYGPGDINFAERPKRRRDAALSAPAGSQERTSAGVQNEDR